LVTALREGGHEAFHAYELDLETADDALLWAYARDNEAVVVTKDKDYVGLEITQPGPRLILVCTGNCSNHVLMSRFFSLLPNMLALFDSGVRLVELR
jgi:predicted nuclease of predicted toxin-antitoxin system